MEFIGLKAAPPKRKSLCINYREAEEPTRCVVLELLKGYCNVVGKIADACCSESWWADARAALIIKPR